MTRPWELRNAIRHVCDLHNVAVEFTPTRKGHYQAWLRWRGQHRIILFSGSASDWRELHNTMARTRRAIREMEQQGQVLQAARHLLAVPIIRRGDRVRTADSFQFMKPRGQAARR
jgi:hypothetical protein